MSDLDFEKPIIELEGKIAGLRNMSSTDDVNIVDEISRMEGKAQKLLQQTYTRLTPAQKVQVARHPNRPHFKDYIKGFITDFTSLAGDRNFAEDHALIGGFGRFNGQSCVIMGHEKGSDTESRIHHNFGMARPEGYRKAQRLMQLAGQFQLPIISLVDTAGAYPGRGAEERGQSEAIARSIAACLNAPVPFITIIIGEGGSGGAIAIAAGDRIMMLEHSIYSVISPEGCASILWRSDAQKREDSAQFLKIKAQDLAASLKLTAQDLKEMKLIDTIIDEPLGGAHRHKETTIHNVETAIQKALSCFQSWDKDQIVKDRHQKFLKMGRTL